MRPFSFVPRSALLLVVGGVAVGAGCGSPLEVSDRSDFGDETESVRAYVAGSVVELRIKSSSIFVNDDDVVGSSADEDVFTVESSDDGVITLRTLTAGEAELVLKHDGDVVDSRNIVVRDAADIEFSLELKAFEESDIVPAAREVGRPLRLLRGRSARVAVNALDDDGKPLFGQHIIEATTSSPDEAVTVDGWTTGIRFDGPGSFLELSAAPEAVDSVLHLQIGNELLVDVDVHAVDESVLERIVLDEQELGFRQNGRRSVVLARGEDRDGEDILGAPSWALEGEDVGVGEAVSYEVAWFSSKELVARIGDVEARRQIDTDPTSVGVVRVGDGCSGAAAGLPCALLALLLGRRRR